MWKENERGDITFKEEGEQNFHRFSDFVALMETARGVEPDIALNLVNHVLAHYRPHALPDDNGYYAAAAGVCEDGRLFVAVNNEQTVKHSFAGRGCAETNMLRRCQEATGNRDVQVKPVYLMSGRAELLPSGKLKDKTPGAWSCLCGECRQNLRAHTKGGEFIMLPTNDGTRVLSSQSAKDTRMLWANHAWQISYAQLYPIPEYRELSHVLSEHTRQGYDAITDDAHIIPRLELKLPNDPRDLTTEQYQRLRDAYERPGMEIHALRDGPSLVNINRTLLHLIKHAYHKHSRTKNVANIEITAVLVKTEKGEFYPSTLVNGDLWLPSKPPEIPTALSNAYNQVGISEVYMMTFDNYQLQNERTDASQEEEVKHALKMPDPAGIGRLIKNMRQGQQATLHVLPINNGAVGEEMLRQMSAPTLNVREAFGPDFTNAKRSVGKGY